VRNSRPRPDIEAAAQEKAYLQFGALRACCGRRQIILAAGAPVS